MNSQLSTLSKVFSESIFRIPDYQRGYAWTNKEIEEFWNDLIRLAEDRDHYVGVLTLEPVRENEYRNWIDDVWLIEARKFTPFYVVDGQQRLTTSILLIIAIINTMKHRRLNCLNYTHIDDIVKHFISESKSDGHSKSYLFSYETNNPSYQYLIDIIYRHQVANFAFSSETTYTQNLKNALCYFETRLKPMKSEEICLVYSKISQHFLFNTYEISSNIDVHVTFETMNNRGKHLSQLELLKNRLIYLSTLLSDESITKRIRRDINDCWKEIYHTLGQGLCDIPADDEFLEIHFAAFLLIRSKSREMISVIEDYLCLEEECPVIYLTRILLRIIYSKVRSTWIAYAYTLKICKFFLGHGLLYTIPTRQRLIMK